MRLDREDFLSMEQREKQFCGFAVVGVQRDRHGHIPLSIGDSPTILLSRLGQDISDSALVRQLPVVNPSIQVLSFFRRQS